MTWENINWRIEGGNPVKAVELLWAVRSWNVKKDTDEDWNTIKVIYIETREDVLGT